MNKHQRVMLPCFCHGTYAGQAGVKAIEVCLTMRQLRLIYMGFTAPGLRLSSGGSDIPAVLKVGLTCVVH
jgi:hypothetical protein